MIKPHLTFRNGVWRVSKRPKLLWGIANRAMWGAANDRRMELNYHLSQPFYLTQPREDYWANKK